MFHEYVSLHRLSSILSYIIPFVALLIATYFSRKKHVYSQILKFIEHFGKITLFIISILFLVTLLYQKLVEYYSLYYLTTDLSLFHQGLWNTIHGHFGYLTCHSDHHLLLVHFQPILFSLLPLYYISPTPLWLVFLPVFAAWIGGLILYKLLEAYNIDKVLAWVLSIAYFFYPTVYRSASWDFNTSPLIMLFIICALYMEIKKRDTWYFIFIVLAMLCKEDAALILVCLGLYLFISRKRRTAGAVTAGIGILAIVVYLFVVQYITKQPIHYFRDRFYPLANNLFELALSPILSPKLFFKTLISSSNFFILGKTLLPVAFLAIFSGSLSIGIYAILLPTLLSQHSFMHICFDHNQAYIVPFVFLGALLGVSFWVKKQRSLPHFFKQFNLSILVGIFILSSCIFYSLYYSSAPFTFQSKTDIAYAIYIQNQFQQITPDISDKDVIGVSNHITRPLCNREYICAGHDIDFDYSLNFLDFIDPTMNLHLMESLCLDHFSAIEYNSDFILLKNSSKSSLNKELYDLIYTRFDDAWGANESRTRIDDQLANYGFATKIGGYISLEYSQYPFWYPPGEYCIGFMLRGQPQPEKNLHIKISTLSGLDFTDEEQDMDIPLDNLSPEEYRSFPVYITFPLGGRIAMHLSTPQGGTVYYDGFVVTEGLPTYDQLENMFIDHCYLVEGEGELLPVPLSHNLYSRPGFFLSEQGKTYSFTLKDVGNEVTALNLSLMVSEFPFPHPLADIVVKRDDEIIARIGLDRRKLAFDHRYEQITIPLEEKPGSIITLEITPLLPDQLYMNMIQCRKLVER